MESMRTPARLTLACLLFSSFLVSSSWSRPDEGPSWVGKRIMPKQGNFQMPRVDQDGQEIGIVQVPSIIVTVVKEDGDRINLRLNGVEWWSSKANAVLLENAVPYFTERIRLNEEDATAYAYRAVAHQTNGATDLALKDHTEAIRLRPTVAAYYCNRGNVWRVKKEFDKAVKDFDEAIRLSPQNALYFNNRGIVRLAMKEYDAALADLNEAIRLNPTSAMSYLNRGTTYLEMKEFDKAKKEHTEAIRLDPKYDSAYVGRGNVHKRQQNYDQALADYARAVEVNPKSARGWNSLAWTLAVCPKDGVRDAKKAVEYATRACELSEWKNASLLDTLAAAYAESGDLRRRSNGRRRPSRSAWATSRKRTRPGCV